MLAESALQVETPTLSQNNGALRSVLTVAATGLGVCAVGVAAYTAYQRWFAPQTLVHDRVLIGEFRRANFDEQLAFLDRMVPIQQGTTYAPDQDCVICLTAKAKVQTPCNGANHVVMCKDCDLLDFCAKVNTCIEARLRNNLINNDTAMDATFFASVAARSCHICRSPFASNQRVLLL